MSLEREYREEWLGYWAYVSQRASDGWSRALRQMQNREYEVKHLIGDVLEFWTDVTVASVTAWRGQDRKPPLVIFRVDVGDDHHPAETLPVFSQGLPFKDPDVLWLGTVGARPSGGKLITKENLRVRLVNERKELELKLVDLKDEFISESVVHDQSKLLAPATYRAVVHIDEVPLAEWMILVERAGCPRSPAQPAAEEPAGQPKS